MTRVTRLGLAVVVVGGLAGCERILGLPSDPTTLRLTEVEVRDTLTDEAVPLSPALDPVISLYDVEAPPTSRLEVRVATDDPDVLLLERASGVGAPGTLTFELDVRPGDDVTASIVGRVQDLDAGNVVLEVSIAGSDFISGTTPQVTGIVASTLVAMDPNTTALVVLQDTPVDNVAVLDNGGNGAEFSLGLNPRLTVPGAVAVAGGDLDEDGFGDLAFAAGDRVVVAFGTGTGFEPPIDVGPGTGLRTIAIADVIGNGAIDLVAGGDGPILLLESTDLRTFATPVALLPGGTATRALLVRRFLDEQSLHDIAAIDDDHTLRYYKNDGNSQTFTPTVLDLGAQPVALTAFEEARERHFVVALADKLVVIRGLSGTDTLDVPVAGARVLDALDLDGDLDIDLIAATSTGPRIAFGRGAFEFHTPFLFADPNVPSGLVTKDFTGDARPDLVITGTTGITIYTGLP